MSRTFWLAVGAVGGIVAYRKTTEAAARAKELGALGTAQAAAQTTSRLASRTAHGLGRLNDLKARREGRLVIGSAEEVGTVEEVGPVRGVPAQDGPGATTRDGA
jgi:hypothetical protein